VQSLSKILAQKEYLRERTAPTRKDPFYLHLVDLLKALRSVSCEKEINILDFGSGGSPYRFLFPNSNYRRADISTDITIDFLINDEGYVNAPDSTFDLVLSTQVLEHVRYPQRYLAECQRVLRPGGKLILSTHGLFEEHGCPNDYRRWTADGLKQDLIASGWQQIEVKKLTVGGRAFLFYLLHWSCHLSNVPSASWQLWVARFLVIFTRLRLLIHWVADRVYPHQSVCAAIHETNPLYVGLIAEAIRPLEDQPSDDSTHFSAS
jgi:SAM-dependent methyltransferase